MLLWVSAHFDSKHQGEACRQLFQWYGRKLADCFESELYAELQMFVFICSNGVNLA